MPSDNGLYKCVVSNRLGNISHDIQLVVIGRYILCSIKMSIQFARGMYAPPIYGGFGKNTTRTLYNEGPRFCINVG